MKNDLNDTDKQLITRYLTGECTSDDEATLQRWRQSSAENEAIFSQFKKAFELTDKHFSSAPAPNVDVNAEWDQFLKTISKDESRIRKMPGISTSGFWLRIAASFLVLIVAGALIYNAMTRPENIVHSTLAEIKRVELPDGSVVTLNHHSTITVASDFGGASRSIELNGEAFFDVAHDAQAPFVIRAGEAKVEVLGTTFSVSAYQDANQIAVIVESGKVQLSMPQQQKAIQLTAGQKGLLEVETGRLVSQENTDVNYRSWNTQRLTFRDTDLRTVIETLNRAYHANIVINTQISEACVVTVTFDQQTLDAVLHVLESTLNLTVRRDGDQIEIIEAGC